MVGLRLGERRALLGVEDVLGIGSLDPQNGSPMPPLLQNTHGEAVKEIFELDKDLFLLLDAARLLPAGEWQQLLSQPESL
jgi:chemotaxis signal transduction protein